MYRSFLLSFLTTLFVMPTVAQKPGMAVQFIPFDVERPYNPEHPMYMTGTFATRDHVIRLERLVGGKHKDTHFFHAFSRETGGHVGTLELKSEKRPGEYYFDRMLGINDRFYILHNEVDKKTGEVDVIAQQYDLPSMAAVGAPIQMARISFDPKSLDMTRGFRSYIEVSEDGEKVVLYFDRIRSAENEQLILLFAMDKDLNPLWQQGYRIPFESDKISTHGVAISDQGIVYALLQARFKNRRGSNKSINYTYELFGMTEEGMSARPVELPQNKAALAARLTMRNGRPVAAGFYVEEHHSPKEPAGYFVSEFDPTFNDPASQKVQAFRQTMDHRIEDVELMARRNGGFFLTGGAQEQITDRIWDRYIVAISIGPDGEQEWEAVVPRKVFNITSSEMGYHALEGREQLVLIFREPSQNFERLLKSEPLQTVMTWKRVTVVASIDNDGQVHYAELSDGEKLDCLHSAFSSWADTAPYQHVATGKKKIGRKDMDGAVIVDLK